MLARRSVGILLASTATTALMALSVAAPAAAALPSPSRNVVNGVTIPRPSRVAPWAVSLWSSNDGHGSASFMCSATAIGPLEILTAAHCVSDSDFFYVAVGGDVLGRGRLIPIEAVNFNSAYRDSATKDDVAVLRPVESMGLRSYAKLASPTMAANVRSGKLPTMTLYGWGVNEKRALTGQLRSAVLINQAKAAKAEFGPDFIPASMIAAGRFNTATRLYSGACYGDSGGPLVVHNAGLPYVVGVTSFGVAGCASKSPTIFTSVGNYTTWITSARRSLPGLAERANRALPVMQKPATISGTVAVGSSLLCDRGTWSRNAEAFAFQWFRGDDLAPSGTTAQYLVSQDDAGTTLTCAVIAIGQAGRAVGVASVEAGVAPSASGLPTITGVTESAVALGTVAACTAPAFTPTASAVTIAWSVQGADGLQQPLTTAATVTLTEDVQRMVAGKYLVCTVTGSNAMGSYAVSARVLFPALSAPLVSASVASVAKLTGSAATCAATADADASVAYQWALEPLPTNGNTLSSSATLLGTSAMYVLTDADVAALAGSRLACRATATTWRGASSAVALMA